MTFVRKGTDEPIDFVDRSVRQRHFDEAEHSECATPQTRLSRLFDDYQRNNALISLDIEGQEAKSTPLMTREYQDGEKVLNVQIGIGHLLCEPAGELAVVLRTDEESFLLAVPQNGVEGVPGTHGVDELLVWFESRYPDLHPTKP